MAVGCGRGNKLVQVEWLTPVSIETRFRYGTTLMQSTKVTIEISKTGEGETNWNMWYDQQTRPFYYSNNLLSLPLQ